MQNSKTLAGFEVKSESRGEVTAVFSTLNVIDKDGDVTLPGAFKDGASVRISAYGHAIWQGALPVGKGVIRTTKDEAILEGKFFLDTTGGRDTFAVVKEMGAEQEWSYGFDPQKFAFGEFEGKNVRFLEQLKVHEVSPVLVGAGVNTRTLAAKSSDRDTPFVEQVSAVVADVRALYDRTAEVIAFRAAQGKKGLPERSTDLLSYLKSDIERLAELMEQSPDDQEQLEREYLRYIAANYQ